MVNKNCAGSKNAAEVVGGVCQWDRVLLDALSDR
jgi:hypothetical protein